MDKEKIDQLCKDAMKWKDLEKNTKKELSAIRDLILEELGGEVTEEVTLEGDTHKITVRVRDKLEIDEEVYQSIKDDLPKGIHDAVFVKKLSVDSKGFKTVAFEDLKGTVVKSAINSISYAKLPKAKTKVSAGSGKSSTKNTVI